MKGIRRNGRVSLPKFLSFVLGITFTALMLSCAKPPAQPKPVPSRPSDIKVDVRDGGPIVLTTSTAEFQILPSGFMQATLLTASGGRSTSRAQLPLRAAILLFTRGSNWHLFPTSGRRKFLKRRESWGAGSV